MDATLLVMAAGAGSRFGGLKQIEPIGKNGEVLLDYSVYDAVNAGFSKIVFVIKKEIEKDFRDIIGKRIEKKADVEYAFQNLDDLPNGFSPVKDRVKPWGTVQAVLCAKNCIDTPFAVINSDDYYGKNVYGYLIDHFKNSDEMCMAAYELGNTLSDNGTVTRGVCEVENGYLKSYPSDSPENCASGDFAGENKTNVCINATMDFALLKQLLNNLIDAEQVLNVSDEKDGLWKEMLAKIPPYIINKDGAIAEWMDVRFRDNYAHRHLSHLYPVFPGREITEDNKQLFNSCKKALVLRSVLGLKEQTGWSLAHLANVYAVTGESKRAVQCLKLILRFCTGNNLFTYHNDNLSVTRLRTFAFRKIGVCVSEQSLFRRSAPYESDQ